VPGTLIVIAVLVFIAVVVAFSSLRIANEYERGVVFRLGRLIALRGPGLFFIIPFGVDRLGKIDPPLITPTLASSCSSVRIWKQGTISIRRRSASSRAR